MRRQKDSIVNPSAFSFGRFISNLNHAETGGSQGSAGRISVRGSGAQDSHLDIWTSESPLSEQLMLEKSKRSVVGWLSSDLYFIRAQGEQEYRSSTSSIGTTPLIWSAI
jgi:hypothetical protein